VTEVEKKEKDPFDEIDFGSYFQDYLDPGLSLAQQLRGDREALDRKFPLRARHPDRPPLLAARVR
jgi:hypothetical protein